MKSRHALARYSAVAAVAVVGAFVVAVVLISNRVESQSPIPPEKQAAIDFENQLREEALRNPPPPGDSKGETIIARTEGPWPTGIIEDGQGPFSSAALSINNIWQGEVAGIRLYVYAGYSPDRPTQGLVYVMGQTLDLKAVPSASGTYRMPEGVGPVTIVAEAGGVLTLRADTGQELTFATSTRELALVAAAAAAE